MKVDDDSLQFVGLIWLMRLVYQKLFCYVHQFVAGPNPCEQMDHDDDKTAHSTPFEKKLSN